MRTLLIGEFRWIDSFVSGGARDATVGLDATKIYGICGGQGELRGIDFGEAGCC